MDATLQAILKVEDPVKREQWLGEYKIADARESLIRYAKYVMPEFSPSKFHKAFYSILQDFADGLIPKLMITIPPQHGKSEGSTKMIPSYMLGHNPDLQVAITSYSTPLARKFNRGIQKYLSSAAYKRLFPGTQLNSKNVVTVDSYLKNADEFEVVNKKGSLKAIGRGGSLTGNPVDIMIIDDLYKNHEEGNSPTVLQSAWDWYVTVADTRLHNDSQQLIVFTRWNQDDLVGQIEKREEVIQLTERLNTYDPDVWYKINFEAIKNSPKTALDPREEGEALWPGRHSRKNLDRSRKLNPNTFDSLYQGNPQPKEGLLYSGFKTYTPEEAPQFMYIDSYTDTADKGTDYLCKIVYGVTAMRYIYIIDILYTLKPMEETGVLSVAMLKKHRVVTDHVEGNNGGEGFARQQSQIIKRMGESEKARTVELMEEAKLCSDQAMKEELRQQAEKILDDIYVCRVKTFHQGGNKESRIISNSGLVQEYIYFPAGWSEVHPEAYSDLVNFKKVFSANKHDDIADTITGIYEVVSGATSKFREGVKKARQEGEIRETITQVKKGFGYNKAQNDRAKDIRRALLDSTKKF